MIKTRLTKSKKLVISHILNDMIHECRVKIKAFSFTTMIKRSRKLPFHLKYKNYKMTTKAFKVGKNLN